MVVTEEQAHLSLWCPMGTGTRNGVTTNNCVGSKCAAWRWYDPLERDANDHKIKNRRGFCGMAARPIVE